MATSKFYFYAEEEDDIWYVFHSETGRAHASYGHKDEAERVAKEMNDDLEYGRSLL